MKKHSFYSNYIKSFLFLLLIPVITIAIIMINYLSSDMTKTLTISHQSFVQNTTTVDNIIDDVESIIEYLQTSTHLDRILSEKDHFYSYYKLNEELFLYAHSNSFLSNIYIFFKDSDKVIDMNGVTYSFVSDYSFEGLYFHTTNDFDDTYWSQFRHTQLSKILENPGKKSEETYLTLSQSVPYYSHKKISDGTIIALISPEKIHGFFTDYKNKPLDLSIYRNGYAFGKTLPEELLENLRQNAIVSTENMIYFYNRTDRGTEYIVANTPKSLLSQWYLKCLLMGVLLVLLLFISVSLATHFAKKEVKPLRNIYGTLRNIDGTWTEQSSVSLDDFENSVNALINNTHILKHEIENRLPLMQSYFIEQILKGEITDEPTAIKEIENYQLPLLGSQWYAIVIRIIQPINDPAQTTSNYNIAASLTLSNMLKACLKQRCYAFDYRSNLLEVIVAHDSIKSQEVANEESRVVYDYIRTNCSIAIQLGVGIVCTQFSDLYQSHIYAENSIYMNCHLNSPAFANQVKHNANNIPFVYPTEIEQKLIRSTRHGNKTNVLSALDYIISASGDEAISYTTLSVLVTALVSTCMKILPYFNNYEHFHNDYYNELIEITQNTYNLRSLSSIKEIYVKLCDIAISENNQQHETTKKELIQFLNDDYGNSNMNLAMASDKINMSESYISKLFVDEIGTKFSTYLENLRMEEAVRLLANTELSIQEISEQVGYTNPASFRRVYKKKFSVTPSMMRH